MTAQKKVKITVLDRKLNEFAFNAVENKRALSAQAEMLTYQGEKHGNADVSEKIKNTVNRLKTIETFGKASESALTLIATHALEQSAFNQLTAHSNYKTACRVLDAAHFLTASKSYSTIIDYTLKVLQRAKSVNLSVDQICAQSNQCYARISNALKALHYFGIVSLSNAQTDRNFITRMSKDSIVSFDADKLSALLSGQNK